jgi:hypothetical protein
MEYFGRAGQSETANCKRLSHNRCGGGLFYQSNGRRAELHGAKIDFKQLDVKSKSQRRSLKTFWGRRQYLANPVGTLQRHWQTAREVTSIIVHLYEGPDSAITVIKSAAPRLISICIGFGVSDLGRFTSGARSRWSIDSPRYVDIVTAVPRSMEYSYWKGIKEAAIQLLTVAGALVAFMGFSDLEIWSL